MNTYSAFVAGYLICLIGLIIGYIVVDKLTDVKPLSKLKARTFNPPTIRLPKFFRKPLRSVVLDSEHEAHIERIEEEEKNS